MGKKIFFASAAILLLIIGSIHLTPATVADSLTVKVNGDVVNVRKGPATTYSVLTQIREGETYQVENKKDDWYEIILPSGKKGWVAEWLVTVQGGESSNGKKGTITVNSLNVRAEPSLNGTIHGKMNKGDQVVVISQKNGWTSIAYGQGTAWISSDYVELSADGTPKGKASKSAASNLVILHDGTNIRKKPSLQSSIVGSANAGDIYQVQEKDGDWYKVSMGNGRTGYVAGWIVSMTDNPPAPGEKGLKGKTIVIDPGHGGRDQGAAGARGTLEKELTLQTANLLAKKLETAGANVIMTRESDRYVSLKDRTYKSSVNRADAFISLHYDSTESRKVNGHTTYYYYSYEKRMAETIHKHVAKSITLKDRGTRYGDYYVLRENSQPSILLELGYMSNANEEGMIRTKKYREKAAAAIYEGLAEYFSN